VAQIFKRQPVIKTICNQFDVFLKSFIVSYRIGCNFVIPQLHFVQTFKNDFLSLVTGY